MKPSTSQTKHSEKLAAAVMAIKGGSMLNSLLSLVPTGPVSQRKVAHE